MGRKTVPTILTEDTRRVLLDSTTHSQIRGLARSIADVYERDGRLSLAVIHAKHIEMLEPHVPELERLLGQPIVIEHMAMLEEAYRWGVDLIWQINDHG